MTLGSKLRIIAVFCLPWLLALVAGCQSQGARLGPVRELRGVWLTNVDSDVLTSRAKIAEAMEFLRSHNINVVYPVVWNKSMTLYPSDVMEERFGVRIDPLYEGRDPLQDVITEAHARGIEVIPWFEYGFASSYRLNGGPILEQKPQWAAIDPNGHLVSKNGFDWLNAFDPEVQQFLLDLVLEVAGKYDVDGVQGDDRLPALPSLAGYDELTRARYRAEFGKEPPADIKDEQWVRWRADILTGFLARLRTEVKAIDENLVISMSPSYYDWSLFEYLQDSKTWTERGLVDTLHPQAYRYDLPAYKNIIDDLVTNQFTPEQLGLLSPGILVKVGGYRISSDHYLRAIAYNRKNDINGEVAFFYEGLRENGDELAIALKTGPYARPAILPYREDSLWRPGAVQYPPAQDISEGEWTRTRDEYPVVYTAPGGSGGHIEYRINAGVPATYDVYTYVPPGESRATTASYTFLLERNNTVAFEIDQSNDFSTGWVSLGRLALNPAADGTRVILSVTETDPAKLTYAGPIMLLLNRRESPDADLARHFQ